MKGASGDYSPARASAPRALLKRSQFVVGLARALRGLRTDCQVLMWSAGRRASIDAYLRSHEAKKLQLGTSNNLLAGWLNTDIFLNHDSVVYLDATRTFPFATNTFDYIFSEHMIEHIDYWSAQFMLRECARVLKPGGRIRIATPDLRVLLGLHAKEKSDVQRFYIDWAIAQFMPEANGCKDVFVINNFFRAWGHQFLYDPETLAQTLCRAGFDQIQYFKPGLSADPNLENLEAHGRELKSEAINEFETMVVEGCKQTQGKGS